MQSQLKSAVLEPKTQSFPCQGKSTQTSGLDSEFVKPPTWNGPQVKSGLFVYHLKYLNWPYKLSLAMVANQTQAFWEDKEKL